MKPSICLLMRSRGRWLFTHQGGYEILLNQSLKFKQESKCQNKYILYEQESRYFEIIFRSKSSYLSSIFLVSRTTKIQNLYKIDHYYSRIKMINVNIIYTITNFEEETPTCIPDSDQPKIGP